MSVIRRTVFAFQEFLEALNHIFAFFGLILSPSHVLPHQPKTLVFQSLRARGRACQCRAGDTPHRVVYRVVLGWFWGGLEDFRSSKPTSLAMKGAAV